MDISKIKIGNIFFSIKFNPGYLFHRIEHKIGNNIVVHSFNDLQTNFLSQEQISKIVNNKVYRFYERAGNVIDREHNTEKLIANIYDVTDFSLNKLELIVEVGQLSEIIINNRLKNVME